MKIVINTKPGGFDLSQEAMLLYAKKIGVDLFYEKLSWLDNYWTVDINCRTRQEYYDLVKSWGNLTLDAKEYANTIFSEMTIRTDDLDRTSDVLISVIEELGDDVNTIYSRLKIVEIPDNIKYHIVRHEDGSEHIAEDHRTWD